MSTINDNRCFRCRRLRHLAKETGVLTFRYGGMTYIRLEKSPEYNPDKVGPNLIPVFRLVTGQLELLSPDAEVQLVDLEINIVK